MKKLSALLISTILLVSGIWFTGCATTTATTGRPTPVTSQQFTAILKTAAKIAIAVVASDPKSGITPDEMAAISTGIDSLSGQFSDLCTIGRIALALPQVNGKIKGSTAVAVQAALTVACNSTATTTSNTLVVTK